MTNAIARRHHGFGAAGLIAGPAGWAISQGAGYALVPWTCAHNHWPLTLFGIVCAVVAAVGGIMSWAALPPLSALRGTDDPASARPKLLLASVGVALAAIFTLLISLQIGAGLVLDGCAR